MRDFITVVSGLPRSGTSLMMQALAAGGLPPLTDDRRAPDESNPRGYLELEAVKRLREDRSWLPQARGHAVKIIHLLLLELAKTTGQGEYQFRVLMMRRPVTEILASQRVMLARQGRPAAQLPDAQLGKVFLEEMERVESVLAARPDFRVCPVQYSDLLAKPTEEMARINTFLDAALDEAAMTRAVDPTLYRQRFTSETVADPPRRQ